MPVEGRFFDGRSSAAHPVRVTARPGSGVELAGFAETRYFPLADVRIAARVGNVPRRLEFPGGAACEIDDNDAFDRMLAELGVQRPSRFLHWLESNWSVVAAAALIVVALAALALEYGVPALARRVAESFPPEMDRRLGEEGLSGLDGHVFTPSTLGAERQRAIQRLFADMAATVADGHEFRLELRASRVIGANAFALPSGIVVMTDELVNLAQSDDELRAVLAHELGHVVNRHALRMVLQSSAVALLTLATVGDVSAASTLITAVPTVLLQTKYSRELESEADRFAYRWMDEHQVPRHCFLDILHRLEAAHPGDDVPGFLSTHPRADQRGGQ
jgi:predicted Zn-dependent protease